MRREFRSRFDDTHHETGVVPERRAAPGFEPVGLGGREPPEPVENREHRGRHRPGLAILTLDREPQTGLGQRHTLIGRASCRERVYVLV